MKLFGRQIGSGKALEFSKLVNIFSDQVEKLYKSVVPSLCGVTCDPIAECSCGTISGIYTCACPPGYYGSGLPGRCYSKLFVYNEIIGERWSS